MASDGPLPPARFFVLEKLREGTHDTEFSPVHLNVGAAMRCPQCEGIIGPLSWEPPYQGELELYGEEFGDLIKAPGGEFLVTQRFADAFKAEGLTGFSGFHPVQVLRVRTKRRGPKPGPPPQYLIVTQAYGPAAVDLDRSRILSKQPLKCLWCRKRPADAIDGLALEEGTWNGEDVFRPRGLWGVILVSERFMRFAQQHALSHMTFVPMEKYVWDPLGHFYPWPVQQNPPGKS